MDEVTGWFSFEKQICDGLVGIDGGTYRLFLQPSCFMLCMSADGRGVPIKAGML